MDFTFSYTRKRGRQLTYAVEADGRGTYVVKLGTTVLLRGSDPLAADGKDRSPNKRKMAGALHCAKAQIESLAMMSEI